MFNCGIDFGSTYTTVSRYSETKQQINAITVGQAVPYIPSVASLSEGKKKKKWSFGVAAKATTGKSAVKTFKAFKMLLSETDQKKLEAREYTSEYTPAVVASEFLGNLISNVATSQQDNHIGKLVVGAPEIWFKEVATIDSRSVLRDICRNIDGVQIDEVQVVSEPAAACAYFAYNFQLNRKRNYEGTILLIDYGGGTLDISLSKITTEQSNGENYMEIRVIESNGAGECVDKEIGKAGIIYMEKVMEAAIARELEEVPERDSEFYEAVNALELELQTNTNDIKSTFEMWGIDDIESLEDEDFAEIPYDGDLITVTYADLVNVYNQEIRGVLEEKLNEMRVFMHDHKINDMDKDQEDFKIAIVGGFGNFYLVRKQVEDKFLFSTHDRRTEDIIRTPSDCELAISYGASLLAAGKIRIKQTAPYSIGLFQTDLDGNPCLDYAFTYKQDIEYKKPYFPLDPETGEPVPTFIADDSIDKFVYNSGHTDATAIVVPLKAHIREKLTNIVKNQYRTAVIGFSMDSSEVVSIHVREYDLLTNEVSDVDNVIELTRYNDMFEMTKVKKVIHM